MVNKVVYIGVARISCEEGHETKEIKFRVTHQNITKFMQ